MQSLHRVNNTALYAALDPLRAMPREEKSRCCTALIVARAEDPRVQEVNASLTGVYEEVLVAATDGTLATDIRPLVRLSVSVLVEEDGKREHGGSGGGGRFGYEYFLGTEDGEIRADHFAREAVRMALVNLCCCGTGRVNAGCAGRGLAGVLLHEAVGHGLEGISTAVVHRYSAVKSVSRSHHHSVPLLMTVPSVIAAVLWQLMMKGYPDSITS